MAKSGTAMTVVAAPVAPALQRGYDRDYVY